MVKPVAEQDSTQNPTQNSGAPARAQVSPLSDDDKAMAVAVARGGAPAELILDLWRSVRLDWSFATDHLADAFRRERHLGARERRFVSEVLYGLIKHVRRIDAALAAGGVRSHTTAPDRERLLAYLVLECEVPPEVVRQGARPVNWSAVAGIDDKLRQIRNAVQRIATFRSFPDWLIERLVRQFGPDETDELAVALNQRAPMTVRVNSLAGTRAQLLEALAAEGIGAHAGQFAPHAVAVDTRTNLFGLDAFKQGLFEAQDEGSQLIADLVAPPPRGMVVDACAGAGGKTLALAAALANKGRVIGCDVDGRKLKELKRRGRRAGATNLQTVELDRGAELPGPVAKVASRVDRVLVDAPCTGVGSLRRNPEARWRLTEADADRMPGIQREICERFLAAVSPNARLVYATCTLLREENQAVVDRLLEAHPDLEVMPAKAVWGKERAEAVTDPTGSFLSVAPHTHGTDGFFAAVLRRKPAR